MFIPMFGALIRMREAFGNPIVEARVGLAGPIWGLGAAVAAWIISIVLSSPLALAIAETGAWINLFNLLPVWQLDGSHAFRAMNRMHRLIAAAVLGGAWALTGDGLVLVITAVAAFRAFERTAPAEGDQRTAVEYAFLVAALALLMRVARHVGI
jgi:Zn-dependent protease